MKNRGEFLQELFQLMNRGYEEDVPMSEIYGALGMAQVKMKNDLQTALGEERGLDSSDFRINDDEEIY